MERKYNKQPKLNLRKGDIVKVIAGDSKGSQGRILEVISQDRKVLVEGSIWLVSILNQTQKTLKVVS